AEGAGDWQIRRVCPAGHVSVPTRVNGDSSDVVGAAATQIGAVRQYGVDQERARAVVAAHAETDDAVREQPERSLDRNAAAIDFLIDYRSVLAEISGGRGNDQRAAIQPHGSRALILKPDGRGIDAGL